MRLRALIVVVVVLAGCAKKGALRGDPVRGKALFDATCDACHYANSRVARAGPGLAGLYQRGSLPNGAPITDANLDRLIRDGDRLMPGYRNMLSPEQMRDLIAYLRTL